MCGMQTGQSLYKQINMLSGTIDSKIVTLSPLQADDNVYADHAAAYIMGACGCGYGVI